ncbi:MAG: tetratricopeptide repeat protein, partial [Hyphomicrobiales bacterium]|nr:tetratricopeptide repeat protein [Hyphomicrobiales bacterium]
MKRPLRFLIVLAMALYIDGALVGACFAQTKQAAYELSTKVVELYRAGKYSEALPLVRQELAIEERTFGPNHPAVAQSLNILASIYNKLGRHSDAEPVYKRALSILEKESRANPNLAANLAALLYNFASN